MNSTVLLLPKQVQRATGFKRTVLYGVEEERVMRGQDELEVHYELTESDEVSSLSTVPK